MNINLQIVDKECISCQIVKPIHEFLFISKTGKYKNQCKECLALYHKNWEENYIIEIKEWDVGQDKICNKCLKLKPISEFSFRKDAGKFRNTCKECVVQKATLWIGNNRTKFNTRENARKKERTKIDPEYSFKLTVSSSVDQMFRKNGTTKNNISVWDHMPWKYSQIIDFFEKIYFTIPGNEWMHKNNRGKYIYENWDDNNPITWVWHLDHIIPHSTFQYTSYEEPNFTQCWDMKNLRPLRADQNISENNRRTDIEIYNLQQELNNRLILLNYSI